MIEAIRHTPIVRAILFGRNLMLWYERHQGHDVVFPGFLVITTSSLSAQ